jgi:hypothetical protein
MSLQVLLNVDSRGVRDQVFRGMTMPRDLIVWLRRGVEMRRENGEFRWCWAT